MNITSISPQNSQQRQGTAIITRHPIMNEGLQTLKAMVKADVPNATVTPSLQHGNVLLAVQKMEDVIFPLPLNLVQATLKKGLKAIGLNNDIETFLFNEDGKDREFTMSHVVQAIDYIEKSHNQIGDPDLREPIVDAIIVEPSPRQLETPVDLNDYFATVGTRHRQDSDSELNQHLTDLKRYYRREASDLGLTIDEIKLYVKQKLEEQGYSL